jgi:hypothetical protein
MLLLPNRRGLWGADWCREPLWRRAGAKPSWHIAPVRTGNIVDLVAGQSLVTFTNSSPAMGFNSSGVLVQPTANVPFIEYDPATGAALGWRVWDGVTNSLVQSQDFATTWTNSNLTVNTNTVTAPDGTLTADTFGPVVGDGLTATRFLRQNPALTAQGTYTLSVFVKIGTATANGIALYVSDQNGANQFRSNYNLFSLTTSPGAVTWATPSAYIIPCANGWYRCVLTGVTSTAHTGLRAIIYLNTFGNTSDSYGTHHIWGAQLNTGTLAPYVPTTSLTASSTADVATISGAAFAGIYNASALTVYAEAARGYPDNFTGFPRLYSFNDGTSANMAEVYGVGGSPQLSNYSLFSGGVRQVDFVTRNHATTAPLKLVQALASNDSIFGTDGILTTQDASIVLPVGINQLSIGAGVGGANSWRGYIREMAINRSRRPNANLQAMML